LGEVLFVTGKSLYFGRNLNNGLWFKIRNHGVFQGTSQALAFGGREKIGNNWKQTIIRQRFEPSISRI
jgi:hypothetical protein